MAGSTDQAGLTVYEGLKVNERAGAGICGFPREIALWDKKHTISK